MDSSSSSFAASSSRPSVLMSEGSGRLPTGVSTAWAWPVTRLSIHSSTRMLSPKPGHMNLPSASLRNQLTWKIFGSFAPSLSKDSQCAK